MTTRLPALRIPPIAFAHRGARADAPENTLEAFSLALARGATGLESDVWITADGVAVLDHDGAIGRWPARRRIAQLSRAELPDHMPTLEDLYATCGTSFALSLDIKDPEAFDQVIAVATAAGDAALDQLWLCHPDWRLVAEWRRVDTVRLVDSTRLRRIGEGPERRAATLAGAGIDAINLHHADWTGGLATLFHRFGVTCFGWDAQLPRVLDELFDLGLDGVYSDHVDRLTEALAKAYPDHSDHSD
ncbi:MAG: glycerophosphodiester phosphodiesterase [Acidimicrobiales bacterium]